MTIDEMKEIKREHGLTYEDISRKTGVPLGTVQKIFTGVSKSPRFVTIEKLSGFFETLNKITIEDRYEYYRKTFLPSLSEEHRDDGVSDNVTEYTAVRSEAVKTRWGIPIKKQGDYTIEDYFMIPEEFSVELIDGVIHERNTPTTVHQFLVGEIYRVVANYTRKGKGGCVPYISPISVELSGEKDTIVQPDVMILCKDRKERLKRVLVYGAPDLIVEVLSPTTKEYDRIEKLRKYETAGIREYWLVDPDSKTVVVYDFTAEVYPTIYGFRDKIPVGIYNGDLVIDFAEIDDYLEEVYEGVPER
ncbi:MAG: Uma2 family endonuclease [Eubacterium sp.]|nr:Uma2 family endonuclease [Eubacterium sp.]